MTMSSIGDLATSILLRGHNSRLKTEMETLAQELASGQVSIRDTSLGGSYRAISGIERSLTRLDAYDLSATEAEGLADAMQDALGSLHEMAGGLSIDLLSAGSSGTAVHATALANEARQEFEAAVGRLNGSYAGRTLFGGTSTDLPALAPASDILDALELAVSGETTAAGIASAVEAWFAPGGDFDTVGYLGSSDALAPLTVSADRSVDLDVTAADQEVRDTLAGMAMATLVGASGLSGAPTEKLLLASRAGDVLLNANQDLLNTRAGLGALQETIENAKAESQAERNALDRAMNELLAIDPYERATQLEQVESQLEILYALTVRTSNLKLTNFM